MKCKCPVCEYGRKVQDLIHRTPEPKDRALIEELYDNLIHAEDDRDYYRVLHDGCRLKHGGMGFADAVNLIDKDRKKKEAEK